MNLLNIILFSLIAVYLIGWIEITHSTDGSLFYLFTYFVIYFNYFNYFFRSYESSFIYKKIFSNILTKTLLLLFILVLTMSFYTIISEININTQLESSTLSFSENILIYDTKNYDLVMLNLLFSISILILGPILMSLFSYFELKKQKIKIGDYKKLISPNIVFFLMLSMFSFLIFFITRIIKIFTHI